MAVDSPLIVILGPTASGKSALADSLARRIGAEILSVDSMQVYIGMDVGTAKPSAVERETVRHHLIDLVNPDQPFTVARFVELADAVISDCRSHGVPLIATGGTPLYYKALFEGLFDGPPADLPLRDRLMQTPPQQLHERLAQVDPAAAARIHVNDHRRMVRALEVFELTGQSISSFQTDWSGDTARHPAQWFGLAWDRDLLNRRINARTRSMMAAGWVEETRTLLDRFGSFSKTAGEATGYREIQNHLAGRASLEETTEAIKIATRQLARKQMKWFRRFAQVQWLEGTASVEENVDRMIARIEKQ